jgi:hypothetical protein
MFIFINDYINSDIKVGIKDLLLKFNKSNFF